MPTRDLTGKVCIVTGAGSGLGRAMTQALTASGATVEGVDVSLEGMEETKTAITSDNFLPVKADITSVEDANNAIKTAIEKLNGLHVLINCAGLGMPTLRVDYWENRLYFWQADPENGND